MLSNISVAPTWMPARFSVKCRAISSAVSDGDGDGMKRQPSIQPTKNITNRMWAPQRTQRNSSWFSLSVLVSTVNPFATRS
jgi:hypothetical protein